MLCEPAKDNAPNKGLDLGIEFLPFLWGPLFEVPHHDEAGSAHWMEKSGANEEAWLRRAAVSGDPFAMEKLAIRLLDRGEESDVQQEGVKWLRRAAELENPFALGTLAERLFNSIGVSQCSQEAEELLLRASKKGYVVATSALGIRRLLGDGVTEDPGSGEALLREAATCRNRRATVILGAHLLRLKNCEEARNEGLLWLQRAGASARDIAKQGLNLYDSALAASSPRVRTRLTEFAAVLFLEAFRRHDSVGALNLAYVLRRGEVVDDTFPCLDELLNPLVRIGEPLAVLNQALRLAAGIQTHVDWHEADRLVGSLGRIDEIPQWWYKRACLDDPEGHLVLGWLARHGLWTDVQNITLVKRFTLARQGGWLAPVWLDRLPRDQTELAGDGV